MLNARDLDGDRNEVRDILQELLQSQKLAVLATQRDGQPYCNLVAFAVTRDLKYAVFATPKPSQKYENIVRDGRVSMLVDNATGQDTDFEEAIAATIVGLAQEAPKSDGNQLLELYLRKHPELKEFVLSTDCALMQVSVEIYRIVRRFQEVIEFRPS
jgi:nitroimidazol reductase NimA-like FMN-containing flavoprotein (pyridoxamine 5'-phosphate oxidase superfamily)